MNPLRIFALFLTVIFLIVLGFVGNAGYEYYLYTRLKAETTPNTIDWSVAPVSIDDFAIQATYTFTVGSTTQEGSTLFLNTLYLNKPSANNDIPKFSSKQWIVWYDPANPEHSTMNKQFPRKKIFSAGILFAIFFYFIILGQYITKKYSQ